MGTCGARVVDVRTNNGVGDTRELDALLLMIAYKKALRNSEGFNYDRGLVRKSYFLLKLDAAAGDEPEIKIDKTETSKRKGFREGL